MMVHLPAFFKWSSIITDDIINTFPMLPITDRHASTSNRAILDHSELSVTGEKSFIWFFEVWLALLKLCNVRCDMEVTRNGIVSVVEVIGIDVGAMMDIVAAVVAAALKLLILLWMKNAAIVVAAILHAYTFQKEYKQHNTNASTQPFLQRKYIHMDAKCLMVLHSMQYSLYHYIRWLSTSHLPPLLSISAHTEER